MTDSQNTVATSRDTMETVTDEETDKLKKYRKYLWKTGDYHQKANWEEARLNLFPTYSIIYYFMS
jgi:hypothetical protein